MFCQISQNQIESLREKSKRKNAEMNFSEFNKAMKQQFGSPCLLHDLLPHAASTLKWTKLSGQTRKKKTLVVYILYCGKRYVQCSIYV